MIEELRARFPWPDEKPDVPSRMHGWHKKCVAKMFRRFITSETKVVIELGSWLGESATDILKRNDDLTLICVDHWKGSEEHHKNEKCRKMLPTLYETFLVNMWEHRDRLIPIRSTTVDAMTLLFDMDLTPDAIYIDADHSRPAVAIDLDAALRFFPKATTMGDDWKWESVRFGIKDCLKKFHPNLTWRCDDDAWWITSIK